MLNYAKRKSKQKIHTKFKKIVVETMMEEKLSYHEQLEFLEGQIEELEAHIALLLQQTGNYITTIPGIGVTLGAIILSEIGDIHRFDAPNKLVAFAG